MRRGRSVVHNLHAHLVFVTTYRRDVLNDPMLRLCEQVMADVRAGMGAELREFNGEDDHVHPAAVRALCHASVSCSSKYR